MPAVPQDLRFAIRVLSARPAATAVMVLALTLGIGASVTVYSAVAAAYFRPVPYEAPDRLVYLWENNPRLGWTRAVVSLANFEDWRARARAFDDTAVYATTSANITGRSAGAATDRPARLSAVRTSPNLLGVLGVRPVLGRGFLPDETDAVALLGHRLWRDRFGGDPGVVGTTVTLDGEPVTVVGVLPEGLHLLGEVADVWVPLRATPAQMERGAHSAFAVARLAPATTVEQARTELDAVAAQLEREHPDTNEGFGVTVEPLSDALFDEQTRLACVSLSVAAGLVLLIACANVANFLLAGTVTRRREMAIRSALGAGRGRIVRQLLSESTLLALAGGTLGFLAAVWTVDLINSYAALSDFPIAVDGRVAVFAAATSLATVLVFGLAPALHGSAAYPGELLKEGGGAAALARRGRRLLNAFMVWEVALALVLLIGAGLMVQSFLRLRQTDLGFDARDVLVARVELPKSSYPEPHRIAAFHRSALEGIRSAPGVVDAAAVDALPMTSGRSGRSFTVEGAALGDAEQTYADVLTVSDGYFRTMGIRFLEGREFDGADPAVVVNETMARRYWPGESPVGRRIAFTGSARGEDASEPVWLSVAGVVRDVKSGSVARDPNPEIYLPSALNPVSNVTFVARTQGDPLAVAAAVRAHIWQLDDALPVFGTTTLERIVAENIAGYRLFTGLLAAFALVAFALATIGVASVVAHSVSLRTHEIGVRRALGAGTWDVLRLVISGEVKLVLLGLAIGYVAAFGLAQMLASLLYSVTPADPFTYAGLSVALAAVALAACYVPARRALRVDPAVALRRG
jgi:putative ABC transport system permease protein